jgi:hypothetical protein
VVVWWRVWALGAMLAVGCAKPGVNAGDPGGDGVGGNGESDLAGASPSGRDMALTCGDGVCSPANGEACDTCPADCGGCAGCAMGFADCNHNPADGCETNLNTPSNCGGCGHVCQQVGGTNTCVLVGMSYQCKPTCDATHADCNANPDDGCEVDLSGPGNCGMCGRACMNPHGTTTCTTQGAGWFCNPSCQSPWGACSADKTAGCTTNTGTDADHCGDCTRPCSGNHTTSRTCSGGVCSPTCAAPWSDCSRPGAPAADDGCETNGTADPGEWDNACNGQYTSTSEGSSTTITTNRMLPAGDTDTFQVHLSEGSHTCFPGTSQSYDALIQLTPPPGTNLRLSYNINGCDNTWKYDLGNGICVSWGGTCGGTDDRDYFFQVYGVGGANSCLNYTLTITYATEGNKAPGCP